MVLKRILFQKLKFIFNIFFSSFVRAAGKHLVPEQREIRRNQNHRLRIRPPLGSEATPQGDVRHARVRGSRSRQLRHVGKGNGRLEHRGHRLRHVSHERVHA